MSGGGERWRCSHHWEHPQTLKHAAVNRSQAPKRAATMETKKSTASGSVAPVFNLGNDETRRDAAFHPWTGGTRKSSAARPTSCSRPCSIEPIR